MILTPIQKALIQDVISLSNQENKIKLKLKNKLFSLIETDNLEEEIKLVLFVAQDEDFTENADYLLKQQHPRINPYVYDFPISKASPAMLEAQSENLALWNILTLKCKIGNNRSSLVSKLNFYYDLYPSYKDKYFKIPKVYFDDQIYYAHKASVIIDILKMPEVIKAKLLKD